MKFLKISFFVLVVFIVMSLTINIKRLYQSFNGAIPFVYGLKIKKIEKVSYLPENNETILPIDENTVGVFTTKDENFFLREVFVTAGIPYYFSSNLSDLNSSKIIFLNFDIDKPLTLTQKQKEFFYNFVKRGGTIIGNEILTTRYGALKELFGYKDFKPSKVIRGYIYWIQSLTDI